MPATYHCSVGSLDVTNNALQLSIERAVHRIGEGPQVGAGSVVLDNEQGSYSPANNAQVAINAPVRMWAVDTDTTTPYDLFNGFVSGATLSPALGDRYLVLEAEDRAKLFDKELQIPMQIDTRANSLFAAVLDSVDLLSVSSIDPALSDTVPFASFDSNQAQTALTELLSSGGHRLFVAADGTVRVRERNSVYNSTAVASFSEFNGLTYALTDGRVRNEIRVSTTPRAASTDQRTIFFAEQSYRVPSGGSVQFFATFQDYEKNEQRTPCNSVATLVASTDWVLNSQANGAGSDLTAQGSVTADVFTEAALVTVRNTGAGAAYLTRLQFRGYPLQQQATYTAVTEVSSSQTAYGRQRLEISSNLLPSPSHTLSFASFMAQLLHDPLPELQLSPVKNTVPDTLAIDLLDVVGANESITGVSSLWLVMGIQHTIDMTKGQEHSATYDVTPLPVGGFLILNSPTQGIIGTDRLGF